MKMSIPTLFMFLYSFFLNAQSDSTSCHTIILLNDREIPATIDSIVSGFIFYHKCPDTIGRQFSISKKAVDFIQGPDGRPDSFANSSIIKEASKSEKEIKQWKFKHIQEGKVRYVSEGQKIKVVYLNDANKKQKVKGKCMTISEEFLVISRGVGKTQSISRSRIEKINLAPMGSRIKKWFHDNIGFILLGAGIALGLGVIFGVLLAAGYAGGITYHPIIIAGGIAALLLIVSGLRLMKKSNQNRDTISPNIFERSLLYSMLHKRSEVIYSPFGGDWEITEPIPEIDMNEFPNRP